MIKSHVFAATLLAAASLSAPASAETILGLTADNRLVSFDHQSRKANGTVTISGVHGRLIGVDIRPLDGQLYGVNESGTIYRINRKTGIASYVSQLSQHFESGGRAIVDFNPQADRLRLIGASGVSFRVNVETGAVTVDGSLAYAATDANAGKKPGVTAGAYTNAMPNAKGTELFNLDTALGNLTLQSPPNDGLQQTRGTLGTKFSRMAAFDIVLDANQDNVGYIVSGRSLYTVDLMNGRTKKLGDVAGLPAVIDIAVVPVTAR